MCKALLRQGIVGVNTISVNKDSKPKVNFFVDSCYLPACCFTTCLSLPYGPGHAKMCLMLYANNKGANPRSLISSFVVRCLDSMICILAMFEVSRF